MNIYLMIILVGLFDNAAVLPMGRGARRAKTINYCYRRRATARAAIGDPLEEGKQYHGYWEPDWNKPGRNVVNNRWATFYFKTRSYIDTGRIHAGDKKRKGRRIYANEPVDKIRFRQLLADYEEYGE